MRITLLSLLIFILASCQQNELGNKSLISGYWEIKEAQNPKGAIKQYDFVETVDFYQLTDNKGIRKKAKPTIKGTFKVSEDQEVFRVEETKDTLFLHFETAYDSRTEAVFELTEQQMKVKSKSGLIFTYHRFEKINLDEKE